MDNGENSIRSPRGEVNGEGKIGRVLERARQERGLSLEEAERATKIRKRYLVGLERDDYTVLPDAVYARGFLKTYANFLGLDGKQLSEEIRSRRKPPRERGISYNRPPRSAFNEPILTPGGVGGTRGRRFPVAAVVTVLVTAAVLAILIGVLYYVGRGVQAENAAPSPQAEQPPRQENRELAVRDESPERATGARGEEPRGEAIVGDAAPLDVLTVRLDVEGAPSWILVEADSEVVSEEVAQPGFSQTYEAERRIGISTGNAGAVSVTVNGQDVGVLGADGEVLSRNFTLKSAS